MTSTRKTGFTIVELLVVVSIIALLVGILLPAIGKARDQAKLNISRANLRQLGQAHATYASEWNDRQLTLADDNLGRYGNNANQASTTPAAQRLWAALTGWTSTRIPIRTRSGVSVTR